MIELIEPLIAAAASAMQDGFMALVAVLSGQASSLSADTIIRALLVYTFAVWAGFVIWVIRDVTNRSGSVIFQIFSVILVIVLTPVFGLPLYLLLRPSTTLFERYYEQENANINDASIEEISTTMRTCHACHKEVEEGFFFCPYCTTELVRHCAHCGGLARTEWQVCPYCGKNPKEEVKSTPMGEASEINHEPKVASETPKETPSTSETITTAEPQTQNPA